VSNTKRKPDRDADIVLPRCEKLNRYELHLWVEESVFSTKRQEDVKRVYFGPAIGCGDDYQEALNVKEYIQFELDRDDTTEARRNAILTYLVEQSLLMESK